jgi:MoxR-like ATPase
MNEQWVLSSDRQLTEEEKKLVWKKPLSHKISEQEIRVSNEIKRNWNNTDMKIANILLEGDAGSGKTEMAKALSANFGLPYTKVTCFADMDKSDIIGAILPVLSGEEQSQIDEKDVSYNFYPSEIVRAFENGYLLEIQEPTVIRDAAVLMALNSALEPDGTINLPTRIIKRHPDFIAVITTNRGYNGTRLLNEALRDRIQHVEKMDLPSIKVMIERAIAKTEFKDEQVLELLANVIVILDETARANAIKGVAGMRSYFFWVDSVANGIDIIESLYQKVIYKITTDSDEIKILEDSLSKQGIRSELDEISNHVKKNRIIKTL